MAELGYNAECEHINKCVNFPNKCVYCKHNLNEDHFERKEIDCIKNSGPWVLKESVNIVYLY